jgi:hypothetical protein
MSHAIDRHVSTVRSRLTTTLFLRAVGWSSVGLGTGAVLTALSIRLLSVHLPGQWYTAGAAAALAAVGAGVYAAVRRPSDLDTAVQIDNALGLKERLSTALALRTLPPGDPFLAATLADADKVARDIAPKKSFPIRWNNWLNTGIGLAGVAAIVWITVPQMDLLGKQERAVAQALEQKKVLANRDEAKKQVQTALAVITQQPSAVKGDESVQKAEKELQALLSRPIEDPGSAQRSALNALQDLQKAVQAKIKDSQAHAQAEQDRKNFAQLQPDPNDKGPLADAQRDIANGKFDDAVKELEKSVDDFENKSAEEQEKQAQQMKQMAQQLAQLAQTPENKEKTAKALEQAMKQQGVPPQQAQQMAQKMAQQMQQAASGTPQQQQQAQQQMQQQMQQAMQQMNNGKGPTQQQQQQMQQAMQQAMSQSKSQAQAQQLSQAAQQMAQAMQQAAQSQQGQGQQQGKGQGQQQSAQAGQQQGQQGQQNGQPGQSGQAGMKQSLQDMKDQLGAMQAMQNDADQLDAANGQAQDAQQQQAGNCNNPGGQWKSGTPGEKPGKGEGRGAGRASGDRNYKEEAPYSIKKEHAPTQNIESGKLLASTLVKMGNDKGKSQETLKEVQRDAEQEQAEDVDTDRVSRSQQKAVHDYFNSLGANGSPPNNPPSPTTRP